MDIIFIDMDWKEIGTLCIQDILVYFLQDKFFQDAIDRIVIKGALHVCLLFHCRNVLLSATYWA